MTASYTPPTASHQATVEDDPEDCPPSVSYLPDDGTVKDQHRDPPPSHSEQPETGDEQPTEGGGAFSRPVEYYPNGASVTFTRKENGDYGTSHCPTGHSVPATMFGKYLPGKKVPAFLEASVFVPSATAHESGVADGGLYPMRDLKFARGALNQYGGRVSWGGVVDEIQDGVPTNTTTGKSDHYFTYGTFNHSPDGPPK